MPSYPTSCGFPEPFNGGFKLASKKALSSITTESKQTRSRSLITNNIYVVNATFTFIQKSHRDEFRQWFQYDLNYGNLWFNTSWSWLTALGFVTTDWVFRFVDPISIDLTGYKDSFQATLLMGPKNQVTVQSGVLIENGIGGTFINSSYPYDNEQFQCDELDYYRSFQFSGIIKSLQCVDYNGSNWTVIGNPFSLSASIEKYNVRSITACKSDHIAVINGNVSCKLGMYKFDGTNFTLLGTELVLTGYSTINSSITRLTDFRIALSDGGLKTVTVWDFNYNTNTWSQIGSSTSIVSYIPLAGRTYITALSSTRVAFTANHVSGLTVTPKLWTMDFNGTTFSQIGNVLNVYSSGSFPSPDMAISALSASEIALTHNLGVTGQTYLLKVTKFSFDGTNWINGTPSAAYGNGGTPKICVIAIGKTGVFRAQGSDMGMISYIESGGTFVQEGNLLITVNTASSSDHITSYFKPV